MTDPIVIVFFVLGMINIVINMLDGQFISLNDMGMDRTDEEIIEQTLELARSFYKMMGYEVKKGFLFYTSVHP